MTLATRGRSQRDPHSRAEETEAFADRTRTTASWLVAADAWEEAGDARRARFAALRALPINADVISNKVAASIAERLERWDAVREDLVGGRGYDQEVEERINEMAGTTRPTNTELGALERYRFLQDPPERLFAYYSGASLRTFGDDLLGMLHTRGGTTRAYGSGPRMQYATYRGDNGFFYKGRCNLDTGNYCHLRRSREWFRR